MALVIELSISDGVSESELPSEEKLQQWAQAAYQGDSEVIVSMQVVAGDEMRALNKEYRGKDRPTNVLSFPMDLPDEIGINLLGDLAFCDEVIEVEAKQQAKSLEAHWAHMVVHGMLHLQAYDHIEDDEAELMEAKEIEIMKTLGFDNPYQ